MAVRGWKVAVALTVLGLGLTACSKEVAANNLEVGDCVEDETALTSAEVEAVDCGDEHAFELIGKFDVDDADSYPGAAELEEQGATECQGDIFEEYIGSPFNPDGEVLVDAYYPSEETWDEADDRTILCFGFLSDGSTSTESLEG